jgi:hypothetical protein
MSKLLAGVCLLPLFGQLDQQITDPTIDRQELRLAVAELRDIINGMADNPVSILRLPIELELERIVSIPAAALLLDVSEDSVERHLGKFIINLGPKRKGIRLKYALWLHAPADSMPRPRRKRKPALQPGSEEARVAALRPSKRAARA